MKNVLIFLLIFAGLNCEGNKATPDEYLNTRRISGIESAEDDLRFIKMVAKLAKERGQCYYPDYFKEVDKFYIIDKYYSQDTMKCVFIVVAISDRESIVDNSLVKYQYFEANTFLAKKNESYWNILCDGPGMATDISFERSKSFARENYIDRFSKTSDWPYAINDVRFFTYSLWSDSLSWSRAMTEE